MICLALKYGLQGNTGWLRELDNGFEVDADLTKIIPFLEGAFVLRVTIGSSESTTAVQFLAKSEKGVCFSLMKFLFGGLKLPNDWKWMENLGCTSYFYRFHPCNQLIQFNSYLCQSSVSWPRQDGHLHQRDLLQHQASRFPHSGPYHGSIHHSILLLHYGRQAHARYSRVFASAQDATSIIFYILIFFHTVIAFTIGVYSDLNAWMRTFMGPLTMFLPVFQVTSAYLH